VTVYIMKLMRSLLLGILTIQTCILVSCARIDRGEDTLDQLIEMEGDIYRDQEVSAQRIEEIEEAIGRYSKEVERTVDATGQVGIYYKMLAIEYMRGGMYGAAYDALKQAIEVHPENPILFYYSAVCAARMSKAQVLGEDRERWLERSVVLYRRAIDLDPGYADALYGLSVLYVFELERPEEAETLLETMLTVESKEIEGRFLLAGVYYRLGKLEQALELYKEIESLSTAEQKRQEARDNRKRIEDELYGAQ
jgi:tetratricopeptide (TPR) repeat protein